MMELSVEEKSEMVDETLRKALEGLAETTCLKCLSYGVCFFRRTMYNALGSWDNTKIGFPFPELGKSMYARVWLCGIAYFCNHFQSSTPTANGEDS